MCLTRSAFVIVVSMLLASCGNPWEPQYGDYFDKPPAEAVAALKSAKFPTLLFKERFRSAPFAREIAYSESSEREDGYIIKSLMDYNGRLQIAISIGVTPEDTGSRIETNVMSVGRTALTSDQTGPVREFAQEFVAATVDGRSPHFDE